ncbi:phosphatidylserine decarboxylase [Nocardia aurantia]|uniref:Phosphatidylserine decarboxylase proenzyme n=1 Tax=Nocardia aurantia TaxID=2585199 RepID=A0A7K0DQJ2_9NOCA|nr:phosphatidylserine decarboxylase [Nocardia aurantia]MQY28029.1 Phosphatidylserine decarboxylase proenzyme [Nocardia aurantia]
MPQDQRPLEDFVATVETWYRDDVQGFRTLFDAAVAGAQPNPDGTPEPVRYDWRGRTVGDLCAFFRDWYNWLPRPATALDYIRKFNWLTYRNEYGSVFVTCGLGLRMTADFTNLQATHQMGCATNARWRQLAGTWAELLPDMDDYEPGPYATFNDFFVRRLRPGKRPVDAPEDGRVVVAPADGIVSMIVHDLTDTTRIPVKSATMNVRQLLGGSDYADRFLGGTAVSCILLPDSYHRYHSPVAGEVIAATDHIGGCYYSDRDPPEPSGGHRFDYRHFDRFRRGYVIIETPDPYGGNRPITVGLVPVGLNSIASVQFRDKFTGPLPVPVAKGEELGWFRYGGSLTILLFEPDRFPALQLRQGQRIGTLDQADRVRGLFSRHNGHTRS